MEIRNRGGRGKKITEESRKGRKQSYLYKESEQGQGHQHEVRLENEGRIRGGEWSGKKKKRGLTEFGEKQSKLAKGKHQE